MIRDDVAINNERVKLFAGFLNALGLALIGVGVLAPLAAAMGASSALAQASGARPPVALWVAWTITGLALHGLAHYVLARIKKASPP